MNDHSGLRYLFDQMNLNTRQARWLTMISEFDFEIRYIKGKDSRVVDAHRKWIKENHFATMTYYGKELQDQIL